MVLNYAFVGEPKSSSTRSPPKKCPNPTLRELTAQEVLKSASGACFFMVRYKSQKSSTASFRDGTQVSVAYFRPLQYMRDGQIAVLLGRGRNPTEYVKLHCLLSNKIKSFTLEKFVDVVKVDQSIARNSTHCGEFQDPRAPFARYGTTLGGSSGI